MIKETKNFKQHLVLNLIIHRLPIISDNNTLKNYYNYSYYFDLFDQNFHFFITVESAIH